MGRIAANTAEKIPSDKTNNRGLLRVMKVSSCELVSDLRQLSVGIAKSAKRQPEPRVLANELFKAKLLLAVSEKIDNITRSVIELIGVPSETDGDLSGDDLDHAKSYVSTVESLLIQCDVRNTYGLLDKFTVVEAASAAVVDAIDILNNERGGVNLQIASTSVPSDESGVAFTIS